MFLIMFGLHIILLKPDIDYCHQMAASQLPAGIKLRQHSISQPAYMRNYVNGNT